MATKKKAVKEPAKKPAPKKRGTPSKDAKSMWTYRMLTANKTKLEKIIQDKFGVPLSTHIRLHYEKTFLGIKPETAKAAPVAKKKAVKKTAKKHKVDKSLL